MILFNSSISQVCKYIPGGYKSDKNISVLVSHVQVKCSMVWCGLYVRNIDSGHTNMYIPTYFHNNM